jgi:hypothetical protein
MGTNELHPHFGVVKYGAFQIQSERGEIKNKKTPSKVLSNYTLYINSHTIYQCIWYKFFFVYALEYNMRIGICTGIKELT